MSKLPYPLDKGGTHWEGCHRTTHHHNCAVLRCDNHQSTIADLRERHVQFIWAIHALLFSATHSLNTDDYVEADNRIWDAIRLCDAELGKEGK